MIASRLLTAFMLVVLTPLARAQHFASVVIKASASSAPGASRLQILPDGDLIGHSVPVVELMSLAYGVPENPSPRLSSLPDWAVRQPFDIEAKTSSSAKLDTTDIKSQKQTIRILLRELLKDYFGLVITAKTSTTPIYALRLSPNGQKLNRSKISPKDCILDTGPDGCHSFAIGFGHPLNATAVDMSDLALYLENWTDLPVVDRTATAGLFAMNSQGWRPMNLPPPPPGASGTGAEFAGLSTLSAVLSSFGLELHREEDSLPFYTVERLDQPKAR
jgi:uncharacterized protein (TIGR03435 family)